MLSTTSQSAADQQFSWLSPVVRPDYFGGLIPAGLVASTWTHNAIYIGLSFVLLILSTRSFQRARFLGESTRVWKNHLHLPALTFGSANLKMLWGGNVVAALVALFIAVANTFANNETIPQLRVGYAFLGLEFYLSFAALLLMGGVIARDKAAGSLDLILTKPVNRWRLLAERLLPAILVYLVFCVIAVTALTVFYEPLPIAKSLMVALTTGIYVGMIGLTVGNLTRSSLAAYGAGFAFIFMEMAFSGRLTAPLYLLVLSSQIDLNLSPVWQHLDLWIWAKAGSTLISFFLFAVNGWLLDVGPRRRRWAAVTLAGVVLIYALAWVCVPLLLQM